MKSLLDEEIQCPRFYDNKSTAEFRLERFSLVLRVRNDAGRKIVVGLGLGYIVPVATLIRWFPDRRGMITGLAVAGFGAGALVTAA